jgi:hypothetical protein
MRILPVTEKWPKLKQPRWTTFRLERRDRDWQVGEVVQVVYKPRRKGGGEKLGIAKIVDKARRYLQCPAYMRHGFYYERAIQEAKEDGFNSYDDMWEWLWAHHGGDLFQRPLNKLTLEWEQFKSWNELTASQQTLATKLASTLGYACWDLFYLHYVVADDKVIFITKLGDLL